MPRNNPFDMDEFPSKRPAKNPVADMAAQLKQAMGLNTQLTVHTADIVRHGEKLILPTGMGFNDAHRVLYERENEEEELVVVDEVIDAYPWEGAIALRKAVVKMFGFGNAVATKSFWGPIPPKEISIATSLTTKTLVPWGRVGFILADNHDEEYLETQTATIEGRTVFKLGGVVKRKHREVISKLADLIRKYVKEESIYRGKAIKINFTDANGKVEGIAHPTYMDLTKVNIGEMVYTKELESLIETNIFTPLKYTQALRDAGIPIKRGILAAGKYGVGKSLLASAVASIAVENGWTFIGIKDASELPQAISFAKQYQPAVIFAEDVDRFTTGGRTAALDTILNTLDGIDSKHNEIMTVLTTNHLDTINAAMLRPGRLDVILDITAPDAEAVQRLIHVYGRSSIRKNADLTKSGELLAGYTPAIIREVVERAKLVSITRTGKPNQPLMGTDIETSALTMVQQQNLLNPAPVVENDWSQQMLAAVASAATSEKNGIGKLLNEVNNTLAEQVEHFAQHYLM